MRAQGKECVLFGGTSVSQGACVAAVIDTGIAPRSARSKPIQAAREEDDTPLKQKLDTFGDQLTLMIGVICLLVWLMNYRFFISWKWGGLWTRSPSPRWFLRQVHLLLQDRGGARGRRDSEDCPP